MPENNFNYSDLGNLNYDAGVDLKFMNTDGGKRLMYGTPPPADVMRYPLKAIEKEQDMLLIRIFDQVKNPFGIDKIVAGEYIKERNDQGELTGKVSLVDGTVKGINRLPTKSDAFKAEGNTYDKEKALKANSRYIWLPIPQQITDSITVGYSEDTLNPLQAAGMALASDAIKNPVEAAGKVMNILKNVGGLDITDSAASALQTSLAGNALNQLGANVNPQSLITRSSGQILQSNLELLFNNVTLRSFQFTFDFTPREHQEAQVVKKIIRTIKKATVPKRGNGVFINSPDLFKFHAFNSPEREQVYAFLLFFEKNTDRTGLSCFRTAISLPFLVSKIFAVVESAPIVVLNAKILLSSENSILPPQLNPKSMLIGSFSKSNIS